MQYPTLFFIYVAKNKEWIRMQNEDWYYVSLMSRFFHQWIRRSFDVNLKVKADILPVIPGNVFDRMSISYLARDHIDRDKATYHFYLSYSKPFWTDCKTEGYSSENFGIAYWERAKNPLSDSARIKFYADKNCAKVSHVLTHELLRMKGESRKLYFDAVHELWDKHIYQQLPFHYFNNKFELVSNNESYSFVAIDPKRIKI
ncbi:MAG: hypothetical protein E6L03_08780 [Thaumarchaeota archaeon]|nr:MAG: hypothetical protein E6L03_08780 [Nitrososphaerota archaeon]TLX85624.1 MAG: hypothetical protein E6L01_05970 [Nitrososphaerota archaeon]